MVTASPKSAGWVGFGARLATGDAEAHAAIWIRMESATGTHPMAQDRSRLMAVFRIRLPSGSIDV
jgi:hypothetical protein